MGLHWNHFSLDIFGYHAWRQTQTMATAVSFYEEDSHLLRPRRDCRGNTEGIFRIEFPLFQWTLGVGCKLVGCHPSKVGRLYTYLLFLVAVGGAFFWLSSLFPLPLAIGATLAFLWSPALFYYSVSPIPDVLALGCSMWALGLWFREKHALAATLFGISALVKLPFILLWLLPVGEALFHTSCSKLRRKILLYTLWIIFPCSIWYGYYSSLGQNKGLISGLLLYRGSLERYLELLYHNFLVLIPENIIGYAFTFPFLAGFIRYAKRGVSEKPYWLLGASLTAYLAYEAPAIQEHHDYYLFPWLAWTTLGVAEGLKWGTKWRGEQFILFFTTLAPIGAWLRMHHRWDSSKPGFNPDLLHHKWALRSAVPDTARVVVGVDPSSFIYLYHLHKKGWCITNDSLAERVLHEALKEGASYMYSDSRRLDHLAQEYISDTLGKWGEFYVYKLSDPKRFSSSSKN
ncbi:MAG: hypothetical protein RMK19_04440 [Bacteroidia bacterium]|nr:hypothetical protein [Bacteroidia bacterium]MDW8015240.1 hypothetical protein [Bacteroidia bacterium]